MLTGKLAMFVFGTLFGSAGFKLLASKDARKVYTHAAAAALRCKKEVMRNVDEVQAACSDILARADRALEEPAFIEDSAKEATEA